MDFSAISSVKSYVKGLEMQQKWQKKKEENDFTPQSQVDRWIEEQRKQAEGIPGTPYRNSETMSQNIYTKITNGQKLTYEEEEYLRQNDPVTYHELKAAQAELESYERKLKQCKTKEDVTRLKMSQASASLTKISLVRNNPDIPDGQKFQILMAEKQKNEAIAKITAKFVQSGHYADLPTEREKLEAEQIMQDAKNEELRPDETVDASQNATKKTEASGNQTQPAENDTAQTPDNSEKDITVEEADNTPEMQKLKRARARAAYAKTQSLDTDNTATGTQLNLSI